MLRRAVERASKEGDGLEIVAVTVLTSLDDRDLAAIGATGGVVVPGRAARAARMGRRACARSSARRTRRRSCAAALGPGATLVTPGRASGVGDRAPTTRSAR